MIVLFLWRVFLPNTEEKTSKAWISGWNFSIQVTVKGKCFGLKFTLPTKIHASSQMRRFLCMLCGEPADCWEQPSHPCCVHPPCTWSSPPPPPQSRLADPTRLLLWWNVSTSSNPQGILRNWVKWWEDVFPIWGVVTSVQRGSFFRFPEFRGGGSFKALPALIVCPASRGVLLKL